MYNVILLYNILRSNVLRYIVLRFALSSNTGQKAYVPWSRTDTNTCIVGISKGDKGKQVDQHSSCS